MCIFGEMHTKILSNFNEDFVFKVKKKNDKEIWKLDEQKSRKVRNREKAKWTDSATPRWESPKW